MCFLIHLKMGLLELVGAEREGCKKGSQGQHRGFDLWDGKIPCRRAWLPTLVFLPGDSQGGRSLAGYSPCGRKELDTTEVSEYARRQGLITRTSPAVNLGTSLEQHRL